MNGHLPQLIAPIITWLYCLDFNIGELHLFFGGWQTRGWPTADGTIVHSEIGFTGMDAERITIPQ